MTHAQSHASFTNWRRKKAEDVESDIAIRFVDENDQREISAKVVSACIELTVQQGNPEHTEYSLRIICNLQFVESNFWFDIYSFISLLLFNKNNTWRPAIPFSQVSADSFRFNIQECSRSLYAFIAFRPDRKSVV